MVPMAANSAAPARAAQREPPVGGVEARRRAAVALDQEAIEAEDLHFLRGLDAGRGLAHVVELAPLRRAGEVERVALRVEVRLAEERRDQRQQQQHDEPRRVDQQAGGEARDGHHVLRLVEELAHQRHAPAGLAARALELVLQLAVLEILEVERGRMLHQPQARRVADPLREQRVDQRHDAPSRSDSDGQPELDREQQESRSSCPVVEPVAQRAGRLGACTSLTTSSMISLPIYSVRRAGARAPGAATATAA